MALVSDAFTTYLAIGNREDLVNTIYNVAPDDTPFMSSIQRNMATATLHEWQTDTLQPPSADGVLEGDELTRTPTNPTVRLNNYCQISRRDATVTGTQQAVKKAGRVDELAYQMGLRTRELKTDIETALLAAKIKVAGAAATARESAGIGSWIATNIDLGATGTAPAGDGTDLGTDGTPRAFDEAQLKTVLASQFNNSSEKADTIMVNSARKQELSAFIGRTQARQSVDSKTISAAADLYMGDFGDQKVVPNRFMVATDALVLATNMWGHSNLRSFESTDLAVIGDARTRMIISEFALEARNEKASGRIAALGGP